ncbi:MAG: hypothetical protein CVT88_05120 [Candidatus Altiarchaeales archaeon HGW-Altiarchaeales-1]|nr:MAG: hypothetical protein CVT88_05120 [Candidatus Altiarchaeales archaeon HGW-Altiarchaeales-1]
MKKRNVKDFRISQKDINGLSDGDMIAAVILPIWPSGIEEDELDRISQGTPGQRALYCITLFMREVNNGGIEQFLRNSSGMYINEVLKGLDLVGARKDLEIVKEALKIFPDGEVPIDWDERDEMLDEQLEKLGIAEIEYFDKFNEKLFGEERFYPLFIEYIKKHEDEFFYDAEQKKRGEK